MKKIYNNLIATAFGTLMCIGMAIPALAQRGTEHSDGKSTPPPAAPQPQPQRSAPAPAPQPQRSAPAPQPQIQRSSPQPQQQQQPAPQPQMQRNSPQPQQQNSGFSGQPPRTNGTTFSQQPRGEQHRTQAVFTPVNPANRGDNGSPRRYPSIFQRGGAYTPSNRPGSSLYPNRGNYNAYRSYPGLPYGRNRITVRPRGFYYQNRGYYRTYYTPQLGFSINTLPYGYYPFYLGSDQYFYSDGLYYRQEENDNYTVVEPPIGGVINKLPAKAQSIAINGMQYYELNGVYYQPVTRDDGTLVYQIAGKDGELNTDDIGSPQDDLPQVGDLVDNLPENCKALRINGEKYYVSPEGYYFQDAVDTNGDKVFKIVGTPTDEPGN